MKLPFRFFRGELNGYYIRAFLLSRNAAVADIVAELAYQARMAWKLGSEVTAEEDPIRDEDLVGIAKFAGVNRPIQYLENSLGAQKLTQSHIVNGKERSERGLFDMVNENFAFAHVDADEYASDIVTEATSTRRAGLVPEGQAPVGYVAYGTTVFNDDGSIIPGSILSAPPGDGTPYSEYYGDRFLFLEETFHSDSAMSVELFKEYFEHVMRLRRGWSGISELAYLAGLLGGGYITGLELTAIDYYYMLSYSLDNEVIITNKSGRLAAWQRIMEKRFPDFVLHEREVA